MNEAARSLIDHNQRLLSVIRSASQDEALPELMRIRAERLLAFGAAVSAGESVSAEDVQELQRLERELSDAVLRRRDAVAHELAAQYRCRSARRAYQSETGRAPRFVDRDG